MIYKIAWRNIWRNKRRSLVIMVTISFGLLGGNFLSSAYIGMMNQTVEETIQRQLSHIQMHHPGFVADREVRKYIEGAGEIAEQLGRHPAVAAVSPRSVTDGMVASAHLAGGVRILGIDPAAERETTGFHEQLEEGHFFTEGGRLPAVVIGRELARELRSGIGSRIVLTFQDMEGEMVSASFRVEGIFRTSSTSYEKGTLFVEATRFNELLGKSDLVTEMAVRLHHDRDTPSVAGELKKAFPDLLVRSWQEMAPDLLFVVEYTEASLVWIVAIILLGVAFGILNTILMSVMERTRELGMLLSVGMSRLRIFMMVVLETVFLSLTGGAAGLLASIVLVNWLHTAGIDLAVIGGEALRDFGFSPYIYPELTISYYLKVTGMVVFFAILASIYPARKATRLQPAEAVRKE